MVVVVECVTLTAIDAVDNVNNSNISTNAHEPKRLKTWKQM